MKSHYVVACEQERGRQDSCQTPGRISHFGIVEECACFDANDRACFFALTVRADPGSLVQADVPHVLKLGNKLGQAETVRCKHHTTTTGMRNDQWMRRHDAACFLGGPINGQLLKRFW